MRATQNIVKWAPVGMIYDPKEKNRVIMRLFFSVTDRKWAYVAYTGAFERGVTKEHCINQAQALLKDTDHVGRANIVDRLNWKDKDLEYKERY